MLSLNSHTTAFRSALRPHSTQPREPVASLRPQLYLRHYSTALLSVRTVPAHDPFDTPALLELATRLDDLGMTTQIPIVL